MFPHKCQLLLPHVLDTLEMSPRQLNTSCAPDFIQTQKSRKESLHRFTPCLSQCSLPTTYIRETLSAFINSQNLHFNRRKAKLSSRFLSMYRDLRLCCLQTLATIKLEDFGHFLVSLLLFLSLPPKKRSQKRLFLLRVVLVSLDTQEQLHGTLQHFPSQLLTSE